MTDHPLRWSYVVKIFHLCSRLVGLVGFDSGESVKMMRRERTITRTHDLVYLCCFGRAPNRKVGSDDSWQLGGSEQVCHRNDKTILFFARFCFFSCISMASQREDVGLSVGPTAQHLHLSHGDNGCLSPTLRPHSLTVMPTFTRPVPKLCSVFLIWTIPPVMMQTRSCDDTDQSEQEEIFFNLLFWC